MSKNNQNDEERNDKNNKQGYDEEIIESSTSRSVSGNFGDGKNDIDENSAKFNQVSERTEEGKKHIDSLDKDLGVNPDDKIKDSLRKAQDIINRDTMDYLDDLNEKQLQDDENDDLEEIFGEIPVEDTHHNTNLDDEIENYADRKISKKRVIKKKKAINTGEDDTLEDDEVENSQDEDEDSKDDNKGDEPNNKDDKPDDKDDSLVEEEDVKKTSKQSSEDDNSDDETLSSPFDSNRKRGNSRKKPEKKSNDKPKTSPFGANTSKGGSAETKPGNPKTSPFGANTSKGGSAETKPGNPKTSPFTPGLAAGGAGATAGAIPTSGAGSSKSSSASTPDKDAPAGKDGSSQPGNTGEIGHNVSGDGELGNSLLPPKERTSRNTLSSRRRDEENSEENEERSEETREEEEEESGSESITEQSGSSKGCLIPLLVLLVACMIGGVVGVPLMLSGTSGSLALLDSAPCEETNSSDITKAISGGRGVPVGEVSKPIIMGAIGTKSIKQDEENAAANISGYGLRGGGEFHKGLDLSSGAGTYIKNGKPHTTIPLFAFDDGIVTMVNTTNDPGGYATILVIEHEDKEGNPYTTLYGHTYPDEVFVKAGDKVSAGQKIAYQGSNGASTGPHVHFEIRKPVNKGAKMGVQDGDTASDHTVTFLFNQSKTIDPEPLVNDAINPDPKGNKKSTDLPRNDDKDSKKSKKASSVSAQKTAIVSERHSDYILAQDENESDDKGKEDDKDKKGDKVKGVDKTALVEMARSFVGKVRYTNSRPPSPESGMDCSGIIWYVYHKQGMDIGTNTFAMFKDPDDPSRNAKVVYDSKEDGPDYDVDKFEPGDVILYGAAYGSPDHASLYIGDGQVVNSSINHPDYTKDIVETTVKGAGTAAQPVQRVIRYAGSVSRKSSTSGEEGVCCGGEGTMQENFINSGGANFATDEAASMDDNAEKIIAMGMMLGRTEEQIKFALAVAITRTKLMNVANDATTTMGGNEQLPSEEIRKSLDHGEGSAATDSSGAMGIFRMIPGGEFGGVEQLMNPFYQAHLLFKSTPMVLPGNNYNDIAKSLPFKFGEEDYEKSRALAKQVYDKSAKEIRAAVESRKNGDDSEDKATSKVVEEASRWMSLNKVHIVTEYSSKKDKDAKDGEEGKDEKDDEDSTIIEKEIKDDKAPKCDSDVDRLKSSRDLNTEGIPPEYINLIIDSANKTKHITPPMIAAILFTEINFRNTASYNAVTHGIAAFTDAAWKDYGNGGDVYNPKDAIEASGRLLDVLYENAEAQKKRAKNGGADVQLLMAVSYNAGPGIIMGGEHSCPGAGPAELPICGKGMDVTTTFGQAYNYAIKYEEALKRFQK